MSIAPYTAPASSRALSFRISTIRLAESETSGAHSASASGHIGTPSSGNPGYQLGPVILDTCGVRLPDRWFDHHQQIANSVIELAEKKSKALFLQIKFSRSARKVFLERGFEGASIEEIAEAARSGKTRRTHWKSPPLVGIFGENAGRFSQNAGRCKAQPG
jgi:hypothetical protein